MSNKIERWMQLHWPTKRPRRITAVTLALVVDLWRKSQPFPTREEVAATLGCSKWGIDDALSVALSRELVTIQFDTEDSTKIFEHVIRNRYYIPCAELVEAAGLALKAA